MSVDLSTVSELTLEVEGSVEDLFRLATDELFQRYSWTEQQIFHGEIVAAAMALTVKAIVKHVPPGEDRSEAIRKVVFAARNVNAAITSGGT